MTRRIAAIYIALMLCACSSSGGNKAAPPQTAQAEQNNPYSREYWATPPQQNGLVIIGVSGRQLRPEDEIEAARGDAAQKAAMYHGVFVTSETVQNIGSGFLDYYLDSYTSLEYDQEPEKYRDKLVFDPERDVITGNGVLFVRFTYPVTFPGEINYSSTERNPDGSPEWTTHPPQNIGNFLAGVGYSGRQLRLRDTVMKSCESAAAALVSRISTSVETSNVSNSDTWQDTSAVSSRSEGKLNYFTVIDTWIDPESLGVWTLAVAQEAH